MTKRRPYGTIEDVLRRLVDQGGGIEAACARLGIRETRLYDFLNPDHDAQISAERLAQLTVPGADAAAVHFAGLAGGVFLALPAGAAGLPDLTADAAKAIGEMMHGLVKALADNRMTPGEARDALHDIDAVLRLLGRLRAAVTDKTSPHR